MGEQDAGLTPDAESDALIGSTLGGFQLTSLLGAGGMAEVYRGYDPQLQRDVAVKVLPQHVARDPRYVSRFRNEAQRVAALRHPNVVPIFHFGEERGLLYLVMPILKESLRDRMTREGTLEPAEAVFLAVEVALALDAAHSQGVVHRDVKPENILLNDEGMPLLSDFGIAREVEVLRDPTASRTLATSGMPVGTPAYMAPELLRGSAADHRVDVYSLGIVLYEMLTGRLPYDGVTAFDVAAKVLTQAPQRPAEFNPAIWPELEEVVLGAMASDPERRYPDMSSLVEALRQAALARGTGVSRALTAAPLLRTPGSVMSGHFIPAAMPYGGELSPVGNAGAGAWRDRRGLVGAIAARWGDTKKPGWRRRALLMTAAAIVLVLALVAGSAGGVLYALHAIPLASVGQGTATGTATATDMPTAYTTGVASTSTTGMPTTGPGASPSANVGTTPTIVPTQTTAVPTQTTAPVPSATATPLLTPTMVVSSNPLNFQLSEDHSHCQAVQKLTNISAVDAQWSWTNSPNASGWQYNTFGFNSTTWPGWPATLSITTPANSSVYVYIRTGTDMYNTVPCTGKTHTAPLVATIKVAGGSGTWFDVHY
ncbi:MAG TPA: serine/threonine-protein kinase [Ktedonobacterales bacterium]